MLSTRFYYVLLMQQTKNAIGTLCRLESRLETELSKVATLESKRPDDEVEVERRVFAQEEIQR